jgi:hypothetical protein
VMSCNNPAKLGRNGLARIRTHLMVEQELNQSAASSDLKSHFTSLHPPASLPTYLPASKPLSLLSLIILQPHLPTLQRTRPISTLFAATRIQPEFRREGQASRHQQSQDAGNARFSPAEL